MELSELSQRRVALHNRYVEYEWGLKQWFFEQHEKGISVQQMVDDLNKQMYEDGVTDKPYHISWIGKSRASEMIASWKRNKEATDCYYVPSAI